MKKFVSLLLVAMMLLTLSVLAEMKEFGVELERGVGTYAVESARKDTATGADATVNIKTKSNDIASMYYEVRKPDNVAATEYVNTKGTGSISLEYFSTIVGRYGYTYKLRVAHRSQSQYSGKVTVTGEFIP